MQFFKPNFRKVSILRVTILQKHHSLEDEILSSDFWKQDLQLLRVTWQQPTIGLQTINSVKFLNQYFSRNREKRYILKVKRTSRHISRENLSLLKILWCLRTMGLLIPNCGNFFQTSFWKFFKTSLKNVISRKLKSFEQSNLEVTIAKPEKSAHQRTIVFLITHFSKFLIQLKKILKKH